MVNVENLFAFDFDDTLAITPSMIGVKRSKIDGKSDPEFREWIHQNSLDIEEIENPDSENEIIWFNSGDFAKYEKAHREDLEYLNSIELKDEYDFTKTASIDVEGSSPIENILNLVKKANSEPNSRVVIITARGGSKKVSGIGGRKATPTNRQDIKNFLSGQGIDLTFGNITTAGDIGVGPSAKVIAMEKYIEAYNPKNIFFYDDNLGNVKAIASMCDKHFPEIKIKTFSVDKDGTARLDGGCW